MQELENLGNKIAKLRKKSNLTQNLLAEKLGISFQAVSSWERNETMPDIDKIKSIANIFGVTTDNLLGNNEVSEKDSIIRLFNEDKMFTYLKGYIDSRRMKESQKALQFAREKHKNQERKEGVPYIIHPLTMGCNALALGIDDDNIIATILLHDVCEDCNVNINDIPANDCVKAGVKAMTFVVEEGETKEEAKKRYYDNIISSKEATITKLLDRCHNVSSMANAFSKKKLRDYIAETREYVLPLQRKAKSTYPEYTNLLFVLKYHICSVINSIEMVMDLYENSGS